MKRDGSKQTPSATGGKKNADLIDIDEAVLGMTVGELRKELGEELDTVLSGERLGQRIKCAKTTYYDAEHGKTRITAAQFVALQMLFRSDPDRQMRLDAAVMAGFDASLNQESIHEMAFLGMPVKKRKDALEKWIASRNKTVIELLESGYVKRAFVLVSATWKPVERSFLDHGKAGHLALVYARVASDLGHHRVALQALGKWLDVHRSIAPKGVVREIELSQAAISNRLREKSGVAAAYGFRDVLASVTNSASPKLLEQDQTWNWLWNNSQRSLTIALTEELGEVDTDILRSHLPNLHRISQTELSDYGVMINASLEGRALALLGDANAGEDALATLESKMPSVEELPVHARSKIIVHACAKRFGSAEYEADHWIEKCVGTGMRFQEVQFHRLLNRVLAQRDRARKSRD